MLPAMMLWSANIRSYPNSSLAAVVFGCAPADPLKERHELAERGRYKLLKGEL